MAISATNVDLWALRPFAQHVAVAHIAQGDLARVIDELESETIRRTTVPMLVSGSAKPNEPPLPGVPNATLPADPNGQSGVGLQ